MFFLLKLSVLTCLFYLGVTVLMEVAIFLAARSGGSFFYVPPSSAHRVDLWGNLAGFLQSCLAHCVFTIRRGVSSGEECEFGVPEPLATSLDAGEQGGWVLQQRALLL
jgi:hypothetical protein